MLIELTAGDMQVGAYRAEPGAASKGGVIVVQEIFGVNAHIRSIADRLAAAGYAALAPAIFDPAERGVEFDYGAESQKRGMALAQAVTPAQHAAIVDAAIADLAKAGPVGIVGFCLGGTLAFAAATRNARLAAASCFYGGGIVGMLDAEPKCPVEMHFGERDESITRDDVAKIRAAYPDIPVYTYPAGHGFNCDARGAYDKPSADEAWARTLALFARELGTAKSA